MRFCHSVFTGVFDVYVNNRCKWGVGAECFNPCSNSRSQLNLRWCGILFLEYLMNSTIDLT